MIMIWERTKGCVKESCNVYDKKVKFKENDSRCPQCGSELVYVCRSKGCYKELSKNDSKYCLRCLAVKKDRREKNIKKAIGGITAGTLLYGLGKKVFNAAKKTWKS